MRPSTRSRPFLKSFKRQRGVVWLLFILFLSGSSLLWLLPLSESTSIALLNQDKTNQSLQQAKQALIAYAVSYYDNKPGRFGVLPCPDTSSRGLFGEGVAHGSCGGRHIASLGRLPWRTLGIAPLRDADGECLWYAVSGAVKSNPSAWLLNADSPWLLRHPCSGWSPIIYKQRTGG